MGKVHLSTHQRLDALTTLGSIFLHQMTAQVSSSTSYKYSFRCLCHSFCEQMVKDTHDLGSEAWDFCESNHHTGDYSCLHLDAYSINRI